MTDKLTAKLSDGREFEVCSTWHAKEDNYTMIVCRPQEKQAREWWCVYDHNHRMHVMFEQYAAAVANFTAAPLDRNSPFLVREVLG